MPRPVHRDARFRLPLLAFLGLTGCLSGNVDLGFDTAEPESGHDGFAAFDPRYAVRDPSGAPFARNRGFDVQFQPGRVALARHGHTETTLRLERWGRESDVRSPVLGNPVAGVCDAWTGGWDAESVPCEQRVEYRGATLTEWWLNTPDGLEQGWDIAARPIGVGPLVFEVRVPGAVIEASQDGDAAWLRLPDGATWSYSGVAAWDSTGMDLPAVLEADGDVVRVVVDDANAVWPVRVDPMVKPATGHYQSGSAGYRYGTAVGSGQFNAAGSKPEVVVGAPGAQLIRIWQEAVYNSQTTVTQPGSETGSEFGSSLAIGRFNDDTYDDLAVGAPQADTEAGADVGKVYIYLGSSNGITSTTTPWVTLSGSAAGERFGSSMLAIDADGTGAAESLVVGAPDSGGAEGRVDLFLGGAPTFDTTIDFTWSGTTPAGRFGHALAAAPIGGPGRSSLMIGAPADGAGKVYVYVATPGGGYPGTASQVIAAPTDTAQFGFALAAGVGADGDAFSDLIVGAPESASQKGRAYFFAGTALAIEATAKVTWAGSNNARFGSALALLGDTDGDGFGEVAIGAPTTTPTTTNGAVHVFRGSASGPRPTPTAMEATSINDYKGLGSCVSSVADYTNDGLAEVVVGAPFAVTASGRVLVWHSASDPDADELYNDTLDPTTIDSDNDGLFDAVDPDDDNDGVLTFVQGTTLDLDGDGVKNYRDTDDDNDGLPDEIDPDDDNDGVPDATEALLDTDADTILDRYDTDDDGDTIPTARSSTTFDLDGDGIPGYRDLDDDGDGTNDSTDTDDDNDTVIDTTEGTTLDTDADGILDRFDPDDDGDGVSTRLTGGTVNVDGDGQKNYLDLDDDNDGLTDTVDPDDDNDGVPDATEALLDSDADNILDRYDTDDDGDTIPTARSSTTFDLDGEGIPGYRDLDDDGDGTNDSTDTDDDNDTVIDTTEGTTLDTDADGILNRFDPDDDGDGIPTRTEGGTLDSDADGGKNYVDADDDNDGWTSSLAGLDDLDRDGAPNYRDLDDDNDGLADATDTDVDNDGLANTVEASRDTDNDGTLDRFEADDDGDEALTRHEGTTADTDSDGIIDPLDMDDDNDGVPSLTEGRWRDGDLDGKKDAVDSDDDGDGIPTAVTGSTLDTDGDGYPDYRDLDDDNDGWDTRVETTTRDTDGDGTRNYLDSDDDNDGIATLATSRGDLDGDGLPDAFDLDDDNDGLATETEGTEADTDNDGWCDYLDADDDNDGLPSRDEPAGDLDGDGRNNAYDADDDNDGIATRTDRTLDTDRDGVHNAYDLDDDNDGVPTLVEGTALDRDADGKRNYLDADDDGDGLPTRDEPTEDADNDGVPAYLDRDEPLDAPPPDTDPPEDTDGTDDTDQPPDTNPPEDTDLPQDTDPPSDTAPADPEDPNPDTDGEAVVAEGCGGCASEPGTTAGLPALLGAVLTLRRKRRTR